ncbi:unnamed protein product [Durusdinium trenchii]|uniref:Uncharacterized protein n=1 Tax=Durusdinium trenchii TaxID=1381693 RepID=A0ABP0JKG8_9DINO
MDRHLLCNLEAASLLGQPLELPSRPNAGRQPDELFIGRLDHSLGSERLIVEDVICILTWVDEQGAPVLSPSSLDEVVGERRRLRLWRGLLKEPVLEERSSSFSSSHRARIME